MPDTTYEWLFALSCFIIGGAAMLAAIGTWFVLKVYSAYPESLGRHIAPRKMNLDEDVEHIEEALIQSY